MEKAIGRLTVIAVLLTCFGPACGSRGACPTDGGNGDVGVDGESDAWRPSSPWSLQALPADPERLEHWNLYDMDGAGSDLYIVGTQAIILQSTDQGQSWSNIGPRTGIADPHPAWYPVFNSVVVRAIDDVWVLAALSKTTTQAPGDRILLHSADRGLSWQPIPTGDASPVDLWAANQERVLMVGLGGEIWRTTDAGASWARVFADPRMVMWDVWGTSGTDVYVVGGLEGAGASTPDGGAGESDGGAGPPAGFVLHSADSGETWRTVVTEVPCTLWHVTGTSDGRVVHATGACGSQARTDDHGATWLTMGSRGFTEIDYGLGGPWISQTGTAYIPVQYSSTPERGASICNWILVSDTVFGPQGCAFVPRRRISDSVSLGARPTGMWGTSEDDVWAFGPAGLLWHKR